MIFISFYVFLVQAQYFFMSKCEQCLIRQLNAFKVLNKEELLRLSHCKTSRKIKKGEVLFNEGEHVNGVYCIRSGVCKVSKTSENGREQIIHLINDGGLVGERSLINDEISNLKATAINDMELCFIPKKEIVSELFKNNHDFTFEVLKDMAAALKGADNTIVDLGQKSVKQRLAHTLLYLQERFGKNNQGAICIQLTREDIANIVGTATETVIRLLSELKKREIIRLQGKDIFILNERELQTIDEGL